MRIIKRVEISSIQEDLEAQGSGVALDLATMPGHPGEYKGFYIQFDATDVGRLLLWWEFANHTEGGTCKVTDAKASAASEDRVKSFIDGNPNLGKGPVDLRMSAEMEIVIVSNDAQTGFLYIIDGSHRTLAQYLTGKSFQDVPGYLCVHPRMFEWAYVPAKYKPSPG